MCDRSDEFDGTDDPAAAGSVTRATAARPTTGPLAPTVVRRPAAPADERPRDRRRRPRPSVGPINFLGQDLPALGTNWTAETQFTVRYTRRLAERRPGRLERGQQLLPLHAHPQPDGASAIFVEQSKDNPSTTEGARTGGSATVNILADQHRCRSRSRCATRASTAPTPSRRSTRSWRRPPRPPPTGSTSRAQRRSWTSTRPAAPVVTPPARASA